MKIKFQDQVYEKRGITENLLLKVISNDYSLVKEKSDDYITKAVTWKEAEQTSQLDACPVKGREELKSVFGILRNTYPDLRARHTQIGTVVVAEGLYDVTQEDAEFQIVNGSFADLAVSYQEESENALLSKGILPLLVKEVLPEGTYLFLRNVKAVLEHGETEIEAYVVENELRPITIKVKNYGREKLEKVFEG